MLFADMLRRVHRGTRAEYNPDQDRDDDGKWTSGGGGSDKGSKEERQPRQRNQARRLEKAKKRLDKQKAKHAAAQAEVERLHAAREEAEERLPALEEAVNKAEEDAAQMREEADTAAERADKLEDDPKATPEERAEAHKEARLALMRANKAEAIATLRAEERAYADDLVYGDDTTQQIEAAEEEASNRETSLRRAQVAHDVAEVAAMPEGEREAVAQERELAARQEAERLEEESQRLQEEFPAVHEQAQAEIETIEQTYRAEGAEASRVSGYAEDGPDGEPWYERSERMFREAREKRDAAREAVEDRLASASAKALWEAPQRADDALEAAGAWEDLLHELDVEPRDADGDGLTGDEEEQDDDEQEAAD